jgi:S-DNA-T family DNA segregation ATPase FtsK/SpoIIIE
MGALLTFLPVGSAITVKVMSLLMAVGIVVFGGFVLGFTRSEVQRIGRFLAVGLVMIYATFMTLIGRGARGAVATAQQLTARHAERRAVAQQGADPVIATEVNPIDGAPTFQSAPNEPKTGLLSRLPGLVRRPEVMPEPELVERGEAIIFDHDAPGEDRIKARIADVIKSRVRSSTAVHVPATAPLTRGRGRGPDPLVLDTTSARAEPPLTAPRAVPAAPPLLEPELDDAPAPEMNIEKIETPMAEPRRVVQQPSRKQVQPSRQARAEAQPTLSFEDTHPGFELPPLNLLENPVNIPRLHLSDEALEENARMLESVLDDYGVKGEIVAVRPGPVVTMYELEPAPGLKASRVIGLADDIARSMAALSVVAVL